MKVDRMISLRTAFTMMGILMFCSLMVRLRLERPGTSVSTAQKIQYASSYKYIEKHDIYKASKKESYPVCNRLPQILDDILVEEADRGKARRKYQSMLDRGELHCGNERVYGAAYVFGKKHLSPWRGCIDEIVGAKRRLYDYLHDLCSIQEKHSLYYGSEPFDPLGGKRRYGVVMTGKPHHFKAIYQAILALRNPIYADDPDAKERAWNPRVDVEVWVNQNDMALCEYIFMDSTAAKHIRGGGSDGGGNRTFKSLVGTGEVVCRDLPDKANGFASKFYVLLETFFTDVLFLDSDNIMTRDASEVFNSKAYAQTGAVLWPDLWGERCARDRGLNNMGSYGYAAYEAHVLYQGHFGGLQWANERAYAQESEAGQVAMNLRRHGGLVHLGWQMIEDQKFFKRVFNGDKDIFRLVHLITGEPFMFVPHYPGYSTQERDGWSRDCLVHFFGPQKENSDSKGPGFGPYSDTKGIWRPASEPPTVAATGSRRSWREVQQRRLDGAEASGSAEYGENQRALSEDRPGERVSAGAGVGGAKIQKDFWFRFGSGIGSIFTAVMGSTPRSTPQTQTQTQTQGKQYRIGELNARNLIDDKLRTSSLAASPSTSGAGAGAGTGTGAADSDSTYEAARRTTMKKGASESESESQLATTKAKAKAKAQEPEEKRMRKRERGSQDDDVQPAPPSTALPFLESFPSYYYNPGTNVPMFYHQLKQRDPLAFAMVSRLGDSRHQEAPSACIEMNRVSDNNKGNSTGSSTHVTLVTASVEDRKRFVAWSRELFGTVDSNWRGIGAPIRLHYHSWSQTVYVLLAGLFAGSTVPILLLIVIAMVVWSRRAFRRYSLAYSGAYSSGGSDGNGKGGGGGRGRRRADSVRPNVGVEEPSEGDTSNTSTMKTTMHQSLRYYV